MQLVHLNCRKGHVQPPTRKEGWDLFWRTSDDNSINMNLKLPGSETPWRNKELQRAVDPPWRMKTTMGMRDNSRWIKNAMKAAMIKEEHLIMGNDVYDMISRHKGKYVVSSIWICKNKCTKNRLWHDILYWPVYIKHRITCTEWTGKMIIHFRGSDYRRYLSSTWYDILDKFLMDRDFTKSKVGSNLQGWMQKTRISWWPDKTKSWKMLWWKNTRMMFGI